MKTGYVGIDISCQTFEAAWLTDEQGVSTSRGFANTPDGYQAFQQWLSKQKVEATTWQIVMEATGVYWVGLAMTLDEAGYAVSVVNPRQVHHFGIAQGQRAKTDGLDAQLIARFGKAHRPSLWQRPPAIYEPLRQAVTRRDQVVKMRQQEHNRLHSLTHHPQPDAFVIAQVEAHLEFLNQQEQALNQQIMTLLRSDAQWFRLYKRLDSIKGIGLHIAAALLVNTVGFTTCATPEQLASYIGVAPHPRESGQWHGRRTTGYGANRRLRGKLSMGVSAAYRSNPHIQTFRQRLQTAGKPKAVIHCACARKLVHIVWAVVTHDCDYDPTYGLATAA